MASYSAEAHLKQVCSTVSGSWVRVGLPLSSSGRFMAAEQKLPDLRSTASQL